MRLGRLQRGNNRGAVGVGETRRLRWQHVECLLTQGCQGLACLLPKRYQGLAQLLLSARWWWFSSAGLEDVLRQIDHHRHGRLRGDECTHQFLQSVHKIVGVYWQCLLGKGLQNLYG